MAATDFSRLVTLDPDEVVTHSYVRDDLLRIDQLLDVGCGEDRHYLFPLKWGFSQMTLPPWPRPTHMAVSP